jgi:hypothetical protein
MKKLIFTAVTALVMGASFAQAQKAGSLEDRVSELEANQSLNIFKLSGSMALRWDDITSKQSSKPAHFDTEETQAFRLRSQLNVDADISKNIKFYSRYTMTKRFNTLLTQGSAGGGPSDTTASDSYDSPGVVVEKAYADFIIPGTNFIFSGGRLPTSDGSPTNLWDGRARMGTYPMLAYNASLDGLAVTYNWDSLIGGENKLATRVIYTPMSQFNYGSPTTGQAAGTMHAADANGRMTSNAEIASFQIDYSHPNLGWADNFGVILQYIGSGYLHLSSGASPLANPATANPTDAKFRFDQTVANVELNGLFGSSFDAVFTYLATHLESQGTDYAYVPAFSIYAPIGNFGCNGTCSRRDFNGSIGLVSLRYKIAQNLLGVEYFTATRQAWNYDGAAENMTNFYSTPGDAYHAYYTRLFSSSLALRVGYMAQNYKYTGLVIDQTLAKSDRVISTVYTNLRLDF